MKTLKVALPEPTILSSDATGDLEERIRARAYELYELRGREDGHDVEDWLRAEAETRLEAAPERTQAVAA
jgi:hypothetical protein